MIDRTALNPANSAIIPYTPPKSAQEFVDGEVVKKAHTIFEKAIYFHLQECKCLKVPNDDLLKWRYLTNTNPISESDAFFSILRDEEVLPSLFTFLDRNSLQNLSQCGLQGDVDPYVDATFKRCFRISLKTFQEPANKYSLDELSKLLEKAIKNNAPEIVFEKFLSILFPEKEKIIKVLFETALYIPLLKAIESHAPAGTILSFLRAATRFGKICHENNPINLIELALREKIATKEIIEALLKSGAVLDPYVRTTIFNALKYGASTEVIQTLLEAKARVDQVIINDAIDSNASAEVIRLLLDAGLVFDVTRAMQLGERFSIHRALRNGASFEIIKMLLDAGASIKCSPFSTVNLAQTLGAPSEIIQLLKDAQAKCAF